MSEADSGVASSAVSEPRAGPDPKTPACNYTDAIKLLVSYDSERGAKVVRRLRVGDGRDGWE